MTEALDTRPEDIDGHGQELVPAHAAPPSNLFRTDDPAEVVERARKVADALKDVLDRQNMIARISGKEHVTVEGWQTLASMMGVTAVVTDTEPVDGGYKAHVEARTLDGRVIGAADALCTKHEKRGPWKTADDYARLSMAQTRATSKALKGPLGFIVKLAGYETTPSEEMPPQDDTQPPARDSDVPDGSPTITATRAVEIQDLLADKLVKPTPIYEALAEVGRTPGNKTQASIVKAIQTLTEFQADELEKDIRG